MFQGKPKNKKTMFSENTGTYFRSFFFYFLIYLETFKSFFGGSTRFVDRRVLRFFEIFTPVAVGRFPCGMKSTASITAAVIIDGPQVRLWVILQIISCDKRKAFDRGGPV